MSNIYHPIRWWRREQKCICVSSLNHFCPTNKQKIWYPGAIVFVMFTYIYLYLYIIYVWMCVYIHIIHIRSCNVIYTYYIHLYTSGDRIYINECRRSKYANLVSDTIIFFCTRRHWSCHCHRCADVFVQKPTRIICLSLSENGKLWADGAICSVYARNALRSLFSLAFFYATDVRMAERVGIHLPKNPFFKPLALRTYI